MSELWGEVPDIISSGRNLRWVEPSADADCPVVDLSLPAEATGPPTPAHGVDWLERTFSRRTLLATAITGVVTTGLAYNLGFRNASRDTAEAARKRAAEVARDTYDTDPRVQAARYTAEIQAVGYITGLRAYNAQLQMGGLVTPLPLQLGADESHNWQGPNSVIAYGQQDIWVAVPEMDGRNLPVFRAYSVPGTSLKLTNFGPETGPYITVDARYDRDIGIYYTLLNTPSGSLTQEVLSASGPNIVALAGPTKQQ